MFIEIDDSCSVLLKEDRYISFFNELSYVMNNGFNYVFLSKMLLEKLSHTLELDDGPRKFFAYMFHRGTSEDLIIRNSVVSRIVVLPKLTGKIEKGVIEIAIDEAISKQIFLRKSVLLCENIDECNFYLYMSDYYKKNNKIITMPTEVELSNGGGNTISNVLIQKNKENHIIFCIVDSDRKYDTAPFGDTIKRVKKVKINSFSSVYELDVHEAENLIPINIIKEYYENNKEEANRDETIQLLYKLEQEEFIGMPLSFFDMKDGIKLKKWNKSNEFKEYWKEVLEKVKFDYKEEEPIVYGFGTDILTKIICHINENKEKDFKLVNKYLEETWSDIGKKICSYGCARKRRIS